MTVAMNRAKSSKSQRSKKTKQSVAVASGSGTAEATEVMQVTSNDENNNNNNVANNNGRRGNANLTSGSTTTTSSGDAKKQKGNDVTNSKKSQNKVRKSAKIGADKPVSVAATNNAVHHRIGDANTASSVTNNQAAIKLANQHQFAMPAEPKKLERSRSFITRGLSKVYHSLTGSRDDGINKSIPEDSELVHSSEPPRFMRSRTLGSFGIKRRSMREPRLEQLNEEHELRSKDGTDSSASTSPRGSHSQVMLHRSSLPASTSTSALTEGGASSLVTVNNKDLLDLVGMEDRQQGHARVHEMEVDWNREVQLQRQYSSDKNNNNIGSDHGQQQPQQRVMSERARRMSCDQTTMMRPLSDVDKSAERYGSGILSRLRRTFSITSDKRKQMNPNWSASLQNLQTIDNMVSYDDLSFIDYDKFNEIDKRMDYLTASQLNLYRTQFSRMPQPASASPPASASQAVPMNKVMPFNVTAATSSAPVNNKYNNTSSVASSVPVKMRKPKFNTDLTQNLDESKNVYRQSLDSDKLKFLNEKNRNSFRFSLTFEPQLADSLSLGAYCGSGSSGSGILMQCAREVDECRRDEHKVSVRGGGEKEDEMKKKSGIIMRRYSVGVGMQPNRATHPGVNMSMKDTIDAVIKSKSLNHLDTLDTQTTASDKDESNASSAEYFTVCFDGDGGTDTDISGKRGVPLSYALNNALLSRNLSFSQITITDPETEPVTVIDENTDVGDLVGRRLFITENSPRARSSHHQLQKASSVGSSKKKLYSSASTEETLEPPYAEAKIIKHNSKRWSTLLGIKNPQQNQLCELLNQYSRNGVPEARKFTTYSSPAAIDYLENAHSSWTEFVDCANMTNTEKQIQSAIWELVTTELYYIHALQTVTDLFLACLKAVQDQNLLTEVDQNKLFSNIVEICDTNVTFWSNYVFPMVQHSIQKGHAMCIDYLQRGFAIFPQLFAPYTKYCAEQSTCQYYCRELNRNNCLFTAYLAWCEAHKKCNRLRLADILVRPMQRLTKYNLLLLAIRKHIQEEHNGEIMDAMIHSVEHFVYSVNSHLTTRQENERLKGIMARIESYDVVDSSNETLERMVKKYSGMFDLCGSIKGCSVGRYLFMEGDLKFKDSQNKVDVHCFLLTDILLICKAIAKKGQGTLKVIRQPFMTDRLKILLKENTLYCVYLNEWDVAAAAFTLQCPEAKNWYDGITKACRIYTTLKRGHQPEGFGNIYMGPSTDTLGVRSSPRSVGSSHSGSMELNESRNISIDFEKTNSLSSDEGSTYGLMAKNKYSPGSSQNHSAATAIVNNHYHGSAGTKALANNTTIMGSNNISNCSSSSSNRRAKAGIVSTNTLEVKQGNSLGQSMPNLNFHSTQNNSSSNVLLVPGTTSISSGHCNLLSPSHRGISYPPPSPTRATLRRAFAISAPTKNPPLVKTRNITSQNSIVASSMPPPPTPPTAAVTAASSSCSMTSPLVEGQVLGTRSGSACKTDEQQQQQQSPQQLHQQPIQFPTTSAVRESDV